MRKAIVKRNAVVPREGEVSIETNRGDSGWLSFSYSHTEIRVEGGKAKVKSQHTRFADGRLTKDAFEGELDRGAYGRAVEDAQRAFFEHASHMLRAFEWMLPGPKRGK
jgi:hypothetical protein